MKSWTEAACAKTLAYIDESIYLGALTDGALVCEAVERGFVDDQLVEEMADRLDPRWAWRSDPEAEWPARDRLDGDEC